MNRVLAIKLAKHPNVAVTFFVPKCTEQDKKAAFRHNIDVVEARALPCFQQLNGCVSLRKNSILTLSSVTE